MLLQRVLTMCQHLIEDDLIRVLLLRISISHFIGHLIHVPSFAIVTALHVLQPTVGKDHMSSFDDVVLRAASPST